MTKLRERPQQDTHVTLWPGDGNHTGPRLRKVQDRMSAVAMTMHELLEKPFLTPEDRKRLDRSVETYRRCYSQRRAFKEIFTLVDAAVAKQKEMDKEMLRWKRSDPDDCRDYFGYCSENTANSLDFGSMIPAMKRGIFLKVLPENLAMILKAAKGDRALAMEVGLARLAYTIDHVVELEQIRYDLDPVALGRPGHKLGTFVALTPDERRSVKERINTWMLNYYPYAGRKVAIEKSDAVDDSLVPIIPTPAFGKDATLEQKLAGTLEYLEQRFRKITRWVKEAEREAAMALLTDLAKEIQRWETEKGKLGVKHYDLPKHYLLACVDLSRKKVKRFRGRIRGIYRFLDERLQTIFWVEAAYKEKSERKV